MRGSRLILFAGLVLHKVIWEVLKKDSPPSLGHRERKSIFLRPIKMAKSAVLVAICVQTLFLNVLPMPRQPRVVRIAGMGIFFLGLITAIVGRLHLGKSWVALEDYQVLPDQTLVTNGIYRYIRHPIYAGDLLLLIGLELTLASWALLGVSIPVITVMRQAAAEERLLSRTLPGYTAYLGRTKRFIPFVI
jgi:protein-S-isoprenylcysteine O-methyltransferase Ste14